MKNKDSAYSNLKIFAHSEKLAAIKKGEMTAPIYVRVKPTNACNHNCNYCHYGSGQYLDLKGAQHKNHIPWDILNGAIDDLAGAGTKAITFSGGGEPLFYQNIIDAMKLVKKHGLDLSIITNGHFLKDEKAELLKDANWVRISLDSATAETYSKIRGIPASYFKEVCDNLKNFVKIKNARCELGINFVINRDNALELYDAARMLYDVGVNHIKFAARICTDLEEYHAPIRQKAIEQIHKLIEELNRPGFSIFNLYEHDFATCGVFERKYQKCYINHFVCVIAADSKIYTCHDKAYLDNGIIGDLKKATFKEIWFSEENKRFLGKFDPVKECRHHCVYDSRNILMNQFFSLDENHINFI